MSSTTNDTPLNVREQIIHIDQMIADIDLKLADRDRKRQGMKFAPWIAITSGMTAGAALFAAGAAFTKFFIS